MAQAIPEIAIIRSLEASLRESTLTPSVIASIQQIHECLQQRTDTNGWRHVNTRTESNNRHRGNNNYRSGGGGNGGGHGHGSAPAAQTHDNVRTGFAPRSDNPFGNRRNGTGDEQRRSDYHSGGGSSRGYNYGGGGGGRSRAEYTPASQPQQQSSVQPASSQPPAPAPSQHRGPPQKYVSKFTNGSSKSVDNKILNTIILGKLNKFSKTNYDEIKEFMCQILDSGQTTFLKHFMLLVFEKAASEELYCGLYATLLSELSSKYSILLEEMSVLYVEYMDIFKEVNETAIQDYEELLKRNDKKKYRLGYSQFLAELIKHGVINSEIFNKTIDIVVEQILHSVAKDGETKITEELVDCLVRISKAIKSDATQNSSVIKDHMKAATIYQIEPMTVKNPAMKSLSNKTRFACMDISKIISEFQ